MAGKLKIRLATVDDAEAVVAHFKRLGKDDHPGILQGIKHPTVEEMVDFINERQGAFGYVIVLVDNDGIQGGASIKVGKAPHRDHCGEVGIALEPKVRGRGFGTAMMQKLHEWAREQPNIERIQLEVFSTNPMAQKLYERLGYVQEGRRLNAIKQGEKRIDMIQMSMPI